MGIDLSEEGRPSFLRSETNRLIRTARPSDRIASWHVGRRGQPLEHQQLLDALVRAGTPFDPVILPDEGHALRPEAGAYAREVRRHYLQEHLPGVDPWE